MKERIEIYVERLHPSGAYALSAIVGGRWIRQTYYGYTLREAKREFRHVCRERSATRRGTSGR